jgi:hypothetical protein
VGTIIIKENKMEIQKSFFQIGIFDPEVCDAWPWHCHYEDGQYLSRKERICSWLRPAEFDTPNEAREFFHQWKNPKNYKMEVIEIIKWVKVPDPEYPDDDPRTIIKKVTSGEKYSTYWMTAHRWFWGDDIESEYSKSKFKKHREILLKYGIDINEQPAISLKPLVKNKSPFAEPVLKKPELKIVPKNK